MTRQQDRHRYARLQGNKIDTDMQDEKDTWLTKMFKMTSQHDKEMQNDKATW